MHLVCGPTSILFLFRIPLPHPSASPGLNHPSPQLGTFFPLLLFFSKVVLWPWGSTLQRAPPPPGKALLPRQGGQSPQRTCMHTHHLTTTHCMQTHHLTITHCMHTHTHTTATHCAYTHTSQPTYCMHTHTHKLHAAYTSHTGDKLRVPAPNRPHLLLSCCHPRPVSFTTFL